MIQLPFLSNYSDMEPFNEEDVTVRWVQDPRELGEPDAILIPGTKSTMSDLLWLKEKGFDEALKAYENRGGNIVGICGGYQMLTEELIDEHGSDTGNPGTKMSGLGLIPAKTYFHEKKTTIRVEGALHEATQLNAPISGYEIHLGETVFTQRAKPFLLLDDRPEGYYGKKGRVIGTYLHHLFHNDEWRTLWLNGLRAEKGLPPQKLINRRELKEKTYDDLANDLKPHLKWEHIKELMFKGAER